MWEKRYNATKDKHLAQVVGDDRHWTESDIRRKLLDNLWQQVNYVVNVAHHPEDENSIEFTYRDARLVLLLTTILSEYVQYDQSKYLL